MVLSPFYILLAEVGLIDTWTGLILLYSTFNLAFCVVIMRDIFRDVSKEVEEAARIEGASLWQIFWMIALPLSLDGLIVTAFIVFAFCWNEALFASAVTSQHAATMPTLILASRSTRGVDFNFGRGEHDPGDRAAGHPVILCSALSGAGAFIWRGERMNFLLIMFPARSWSDHSHHRFATNDTSGANVAIVELSKVSKKYGDVLALRDFNLTTRDGEFVVLVGPSGCGKTTTMRMIAGLETVTEGEIKIGGKNVVGMIPRERDVAMVFQNYALFPHLNVFGNLSFGLRLRKVPKEQVAEKVRSVAKVLDIEHLLERKPKELSGGERQRVALGRAIVREPKVFLMDEPLSNIDAKLRVEMRAEIIKLQRRLGCDHVLCDP